RLMTKRHTALRVDAQRNRDRILAAATAAFAAGGTTTLEGIAREAGVGCGTLYRRFPSREVLVEEVYSDQIRPLREQADHLLGTLTPPLALRAWMSTFVDWTTAREGVVETLAAMSATGRFSTGPVCDEVLSILGRIIDSVVYCGEIRADSDPLDISALLAGALSVADRTGQSGQLDTLLDLIYDSVRTSPDRGAP